MKILILKPSSLGDVVHALPVLRLLKRHWPASEVFWWIEDRLAPLLEADPDLAGLFRFPRQHWARPAGWAALWTSLRAARQRRFDRVIDLQGLARSALFGWLANGGLFVGLDNPGEGGREGARAFYDLTPPRCAPGTHAVARYLAVLPLLGVPVPNGFASGAAGSGCWPFTWLPERPQVAAHIRARWPVGDAPWLALIPGARWPSKRWPAAHFAALLQRLPGRLPEARCVVLGGAADQELGRSLAAADPARVLDLTGRTTLPELVEWLRLCRLVVSNDTGPMHLAAALGRPVLALFGPTDPASTGPYSQRAHVLQHTALPCVPCLKATCSWPQPLECLRALTPEKVAEEVARRWAGELGAGS